MWKLSVFGKRSVLKRQNESYSSYSVENGYLKYEQMVSRFEIVDLLMDRFKQRLHPRRIPHQRAKLAHLTPRLILFSSVLSLQHRCHHIAATPQESYETPTQLQVRHLHYEKICGIWMEGRVGKGWTVGAVYN